MAQKTIDWRALLRDAPDEALSEEWVRRHSVGRPPKLNPCEWCKQEFNAKDLRAHRPHCPERLSQNPAELERARALLAYAQQKTAKQPPATKKATAAPRKRPTKG